VARVLEERAPARSSCPASLALPHAATLIRAVYRGGYRIHLTFNDNQEKTIDFEQWLDDPAFEPLKNIDDFRTFFLDGGTVVWPNGADIAPETLHADRSLGEEAA
jgi:hypothetical protein